MITTIVRKKDDNKLYGLIVSESDKLIMVLKENDFQFDGYQIVKRSDVKEMYISDSNDYCAKIMKRESLWKVRHPKWVSMLDLSTWHSVFSGIKCKVVIAENENENGGIYIGPIGGISESFVTINWFDGVGIFGEPVRVRLSKLTTCKFLDRYSTIHSKYCESG